DVLDAGDGVAAVADVLRLGQVHLLGGGVHLVAHRSTPLRANQPAYSSSLILKRPANSRSVWVRWVWGRCVMPCPPGRSVNGAGAGGVAGVPNGRLCWARAMPSMARSVCSVRGMLRLTASRTRESKVGR